MYLTLYRCHFRRTIILRTFAVISCVCIVFILLNSVFHSPASIACYGIKARTLPDIMDASPLKGKSIFFIETSCNSYKNGKIVITPHQACAVESAVRMNPNFEVYLLYLSPGIIKYEGTKSDRILKALLSYKNLKINHVDYERYTKGTPVENLCPNRKLESSKCFLNHARDVLRYLTLWKYGGIYMDLNVVVLKSLEDLPPNYAGAESRTTIASGVLNFSPNGSGHEFAKMCLQDIEEHFRGNCCGYNGSGVITRLLRKLCKAETGREILKRKCKGFTVYPKEVFYPLWYWGMFFHSEPNDNMFNITIDSFTIRLSNKWSEKTSIYIRSVIEESMFGKKFCPNVFGEFHKHI